MLTTDCTDLTDQEQAKTETKECTSLRFFQTELGRMNEQDGEDH